VLKVDDGKVTGALSSARDITEQKRMQEEVSSSTPTRTPGGRAHGQLSAANRELEAFAYSVSHDLRAPLRAVDGFTGILLADHESALNEEGKRVCAVIRENSRRMGRLIDDLLAFSRLGRADLNRTPIDMQQLVRDVLRSLGVKNESI